MTGVRAAVRREPQNRFMATSGNPVYCVAPHSNALIYSNKLRFSQFSDALSTGFAEVALWAIMPES